MPAKNPEDERNSRTALDGASTEAVERQRQFYLSADLAGRLDGKGMQHVRGAPYHRQTQGKIERRRQTLKNHILPESACIGGPIKAKANKLAMSEMRQRRRH
jgi:transposase InsO family protein